MLITMNQLLFGLTLCVAGERWTERGWRNGQRSLPCLQSTCRKSQPQLLCSGPAHSDPLGHSTPIKVKEEEYCHCHQKTGIWEALRVLQTEEESKSLNLLRSYNSALSLVPGCLHCELFSYKRNGGKTTAGVVFDLHKSNTTKMHWKSDYTQQCLCICVATLPT